jgi:hypothetical protein
MHGCRSSPAEEYHNSLVPLHTVFGKHSKQKKMLQPCHQQRNNWLYFTWMFRPSGAAQTLIPHASGQCRGNTRPNKDPEHAKSNTRAFELRRSDDAFGFNGLYIPSIPLYVYSSGMFKTLCHGKVQTGDKKKGPVLVSERREERYRVR